MSSVYFYQIIVCIIFIAGLWVISRILSKKNVFLKGASSSNAIEIIERKYINQKESLMLVTVYDELLLIGVTNSQINLIKKIERKKSK